MNPQFLSFSIRSFQYQDSTILSSQGRAYDRNLLDTENLNEFQIVEEDANGGIPTLQIKRKE